MLRSKFESQQDVERIGEMKIAYKLFVVESERKRPVGYLGVRG
jgi:hypothetical protein